MDRLSLLDAGFWYLEDGHTSLHIASVTVFDGPAPSYPELIDAVECKLSSLPRYRMRLRSVPFGIARPVWVDDRAFDLAFHVRHTALPAPGGDTELRALVQRLMSQAMDPDHPLWEAWLVDGMSDGQWAVVWKVHHSMVDGVGGMELLACMLDAGADSKPPPVREWHPRPEPSALRLVAAAATDRARGGAGVARSLAASARRPAATAKLLAGASRGVLRYATAARPVSKSSLVGGLESSRAFDWVSVDLAEVSTVRHALGGSINDVVLAMVTRAFRETLLARDEWPGPHSMRSLIPVSVRLPGDRSGTDNRISALIADLPVHLERSVEAYRSIVEQTSG